MGGTGETANLTTEQLAALARSALEEIKGQEIICLPVSELTTMTDYMLIATGTSSTHVKALADELIRQAKKAGVRIQGVEGQEQAEWVLVDLGAVVVHIMLAATRRLYNLEDLWNFRPLQANEE